MKTQIFNKIKYDFKGHFYVMEMFRDPSFLLLDLLT